MNNRFFNFLVLAHIDKLCIERRTEKGIWQNLHQFYLIETTESIDIAALHEQEHYKPFVKNKTKPQLETTLKQRLTHQLIESKIYFLQLKTIPENLPKNGFWVKRIDLNKYAFPKTLVSFLETVAK